jgi:hypothetical protein
MSSVFRFQCPTAIAPGNTEKLLRKRKRREVIDLIPIAADSSSITDTNGTWPIEAYRNFAAGRRVTLTRIEADLIAIANPGVRPPAVLEDDHPWLPRMPFLSNSEANFRSLNSIIRLYGRHLVTAAAFCDVKWNTICNAIRTKNDMDARFYTAWHLPIQDVFILEELRLDRSVVAIDFNAMYSACMQQRFPKSAAMRYISYNRDVRSDECLPIGLYRCVLRNPFSDFIWKHNPFRSFFSGRHLQTMLSEPVEVDLHEFEVDFFRRHFKHIHLIDAVISDQSIEHPLAREVRRSFARRKHYHAQGNKPLADREKYLATLMSSCSQRPSRSRRIFGSRNGADEYLLNNYGIKSNADEPDSASEIWLRGRKGITAAVTPNGLTVDAPDLLDGTAHFLLNQRIVARGRICILEAMERISNSVPDVEICYVNIDSIHFSLPTIHLANTLASLEAEASKEMGSFRIESVTRHGLWLEPGRYWLYSEIVEKFRNRGVSDRVKPFKDHAIHVTSRKIGDLHIPIRMTIRMDRTMSDTRSVIDDVHVGIARQSLIEVGNASSFVGVLEQLDVNQKTSISKRIRAFEDLRVRVDRKTSRCLGTS